MLTLGIETSCDDTSSAVLDGGSCLLSNVVLNQNQIHSKYGGIVPELASRSHIDAIHHVVEEALEKAGVSLGDIELIAVTSGPGLIGSLLVGVNIAKGMGYALKIPVIGVNHLEGHLLAVFLQETIKFPYLALIVSGGHTELCRVNGFGKYQVLGKTRDDAAGESFDKVAKMMGLGFPGGPVIEKLARTGDPTSHKFPRAFLEKGSLDFSFSGLKTSVRTLLGNSSNADNSPLSQEDIAACFQEAAVDILVKKSLMALEYEGLNRLVITGGVAANGYLRKRANDACATKGIDTYFPKPEFCTDNAAMVACAGFHNFILNGKKGRKFLNMDAESNLSL